MTKDEEKEVRREFEQWWEKNYTEFGGARNLAQLAWKAARARDAARIAELEREVSMLRNLLDTCYDSFVDSVEGGTADEFFIQMRHAVDETQPTADAFVARIKA